MVKKASIEEDFPTNNKDSVCASFLRVQYLMKVAGQTVDPETYEKVNLAAEMYGVKGTLEKAASKFAPTVKEDPSWDVRGQFEDSLNCLMSLEKTAALAEKVYELDGDKASDLAKIYSGNAYLDKVAAVKALANRYYATKEPFFVKAAHVVRDSIREDNPEQIRGLCKVVSEMDKKAGLDLKGFNFYRECLMTKVAGLTIKLAGTEVPYETIAKFGNSRIGSLMGSDVAKGLTGSPVDDKYVLESLPRDLQMILKSALKSV